MHSSSLPDRLARKRPVAAVGARAGERHRRRAVVGGEVEEEGVVRDEAAGSASHPLLQQRRVRRVRARAAPLDGEAILAKRRAVDDHDDGLRFQLDALQRHVEFGAALAGGHGVRAVVDTIGELVEVLLRGQQH